MLPGDGGPSGPPKAYHIPFRPIADPAATARARERRPKMFALTKAAYSDPRVSFPLGLILMKPPRFPCLLSAIKPYDVLRGRTGGLCLPCYQNLMMLKMVMLNEHSRHKEINILGINILLAAFGYMCLAMYVPTRCVLLTRTGRFL